MCIKFFKKLMRKKNKNETEYIKNTDNSFYDIFLKEDAKLYVSPYVSPSIKIKKTNSTGRVKQ